MLKQIEPVITTLNKAELKIDKNKSRTNWQSKEKKWISERKRTLITEIKLITIVALIASRVSHRSRSPARTYVFFGKEYLTDN